MAFFCESCYRDPSLVCTVIDSALPRPLVIYQGVAYDPQERLAVVREFIVTNSGGFIAAAQAQSGLWGYIDERAQWIVPPTLADARAFSEDKLSRFMRDERWGFVNSAGEIVIPAQYPDAIAFSHGLAAVQVDKNKWRYITTSGEFAFADTFLRASRFSACGLAAACKKRQEKIGYINRAGLWAIAPQFTSSLAFSDACVAPASLDGDRYGLIDSQGTWLLAPTYPNINAFNDDGLAYYDEDDSWTNGHGYLNTRGECVIKGDRDLSSHMVNGVVATDYKGSRYLRKDGTPLCDRYFSWGNHFNELGFALVRTPAATWSESPGRAINQEPVWGVLREDGSFTPVAADLLEPVTTADGWLPETDSNTPFAAFIGKDGHVTWLDGEAHAAYRLRYDGQTGATLYDAGGNSLWTSASRDVLAPPVAFFSPPIARHLDELDDIDNVVVFARRMLADTEARLHAFASGAPLPDHDSEDDEEDDDDDEAHINATAVKKRLVRAYVNENHNGAYEFLSSTNAVRVDLAANALRQHLTDAFGAPDPDPESSALQRAYAATMSAWPIFMQQRWATARDASTSTLVEADQLWLGMYESSDSGDGDVWQEVWLLCAPSIDALQTAMQLRTRLIPDADAEADAQEADDDEQRANNTATPRPVSYADWLHAVQTDKHAISEAPASLLDDAMVNAAVNADTEALEYVPPRFQTRERLEALVRRGVATAISIPPQCMTADALRLARTLYGEDADWAWRDQRNGKLPAEWVKNCLYDVWGSLLTEDHCVKAVTGGESLKCVPHWLRSERVERAAFDADAYNISYIAPEKITATMAARAVRHDYGQLIEVIPPALITPELCLASAQTNGLSLEHIPEPFKTVAVCAAALADDPRVFVYVPDAIRIDVCTRLIDGATKTSRWHSYRAWSRVWQRDFDGAIADATLAIDYLEHPVHAHYVRALAYRELGRTREAALEAAVVLAVSDPYVAEYNDDEDTSWLNDAALGAMANSGDAALLDALREHPLALAQVPRERITQAMVELAVSANPAAVEYVPKRLMTPALYVVAVAQRCKQFAHIPPHQLSEAACINEVSDQGYALERIPAAWRTLAVCAAAVRDRGSAIEHVPEAMREAVLKAVAAAPNATAEDSEAADDDSDKPREGALSRWLTQKATAQLSGAYVEASAVKKAGAKMLLFAWIMNTALGAKTTLPATQSGVVGWLARRPFAALVINALLAIVALVGHGFVVFAAWRAEGVWTALATAIFMGVAELYWAWRFFFSEPLSAMLGATSLIVAL